MIKNIILDFGHGGIDNNGVYTTAPSKMYKFPNGDIGYEGVLNRQIGGHVLTCLRSHLDLNVVTTVAETDPRDLSLPWRVRVANSYDPKETIFISIHNNAGGGEGFELYTTKGITKSDKLAESLATNMERTFKKYDMKLRYDFSDKDKDKEIDFYVLRKTKCSAVLLECGFFDNRSDFDKLKDPLFQAHLGSFIYTGIIEYINKENEK